MPSSNALKAKSMISIPRLSSVEPIKPRFVSDIPRQRRNWAQELEPLRTRPDIWAILGDFLKGTAGSLRQNRKLRNFEFFERTHPDRREATLFARYTGK